MRSAIDRRGVAPGQIFSQRAPQHVPRGVSFSSPACAQVAGTAFPARGLPGATGRKVSDSAHPGPRAAARGPGCFEEAVAAFGALIEHGGSGPQAPPEGPGAERHPAGCRRVKAPARGNPSSVPARGLPGATGRKVSDSKHPGPRAAARGPGCFEEAVAAFGALIEHGGSGPQAPPEGPGAEWHPAGGRRMKGLSRGKPAKSQSAPIDDRGGRSDPAASLDSDTNGEY